MNLKRKCGRKQLSDSLPRKKLTIDIPESEKHCECGSDLVKIGEDISELLIHIPEQIYVLQTIRPKYACRNCGRKAEKQILHVAGIRRTERKTRGLVPYDYLRCLFEQVADLDENSDWSKLLPWNIKITPWKDLGQW